MYMYNQSEEKKGKKKKVKSNLTVLVNDETNFVCSFVWNEKINETKIIKIG